MNGRRGLIMNSYFGGAGQDNIHIEGDLDLDVVGSVIEGAGRDNIHVKNGQVPSIQDSIVRNAGRHNLHVEKPLEALVRGMSAKERKRLLRDLEAAHDDDSKRAAMRKHFALWDFLGPVLAASGNVASIGSFVLALLGRLGGK